MKKQKEKFIISLISFMILCLLLLLDQYTKRLAVVHLKGQAPFVLIDRVLEFNYLENTGAAFSSFSGKQTFLILLTALVILLLLWKYVSLPITRRFFGMRFCILLILSGAVGNLIDRVINRYVVDFIYFVPIDTRINVERLTKTIMNQLASELGDVISKRYVELFESRK